MQSETLRSARAQLAAAHRKDRQVTPERQAELNRDYTALKISEYIAQEVRKIPPLTDDQVRRISLIMRGQATN